MMLLIDLFSITPSFLDSARYIESVEFFFTDTIVIFLMLIIIIFIVSIIRSYFPPEKTRKLLGKGKARGFIRTYLPLQDTIEEVIKEIGITVTVETVTDLQKVMEYGVMKAPAVVVNEKIKALGRIPSKIEIKKYLQDEMNA